MEKRKSRRHLRVMLVLAATVAGTAAVGFGGLAAWDAYSMNQGNSVAAGTLVHYQGASCQSLLGTIPTTTGNGWCTATITVSGVDPANWTSTSGTITIANTGSLQSNFYISVPTSGSQAPTGSLCADVTLAVSDTAAHYYYGTSSAGVALTGTFASTELYNASGSYNWTGGGTAGTGTGATGNVFTVKVAPATTFAADSTDAGTSCSFGLLFTQAAD